MNKTEKKAIRRRENFGQLRTECFTGLTHNTTFTLRNHWDKIHFVELKNIHIPYSWYNVSAELGNLTFNVTETAVNTLVTLTAGRYGDGPALALELQTRLNAVATNTYTVTFNTTTFKFTISATGNFRLELATLPTLARLIGFPVTDPAETTSFTSANVIDLTLGINYIGFRFQEMPYFNRHKIGITPTGTYETGFFCLVPIKAEEFGFKIYYSEFWEVSSTLYEHKSSDSFFVLTPEFYLVSDLGEFELNLNGPGIDMVFDIYVI